MGLTRKKVTVRTKKGKTFQRSVMVRAEAIGKRTGGKKLNSLNPWEAHHTAHVKGDFPKSSGSSGPGSDHSWFALSLGALRKNLVTHRDDDGVHESTHEPFTAAHAQHRRELVPTVARALSSRVGRVEAGTEHVRQYVAITHGAGPIPGMLSGHNLAERRQWHLAEAFGVRQGDVEIKNTA